jgi:transcriptional regulator with XRE-family HTH domain
MGQEPRGLAPYLSARHFFGAELRHWRELRRLSQDQLGGAVHVSGDLIGKVEKATRWPPLGLAEACDVALGTKGALERLWPLVDAQRTTQGQPAHDIDVDNAANDADNPSVAIPWPAPTWKMTFQVDEEGNVWAQVDRRTLLIGSAAALVGRGSLTSRSFGAAGEHDPFGFARFAGERWPALRLCRPAPDYGIDWTMLIPGGRATTGSELAVQVHAAHSRSTGGLNVRINDAQRTDEFISRPGRAVLVAADAAGEAQRFYLLDASNLRGRSSAAGRAPLDVTVPEAYELDDLTYGIIWTAASLDDALGADDRLLEEVRSDLTMYEQWSASAVSREVATGLSPVSHMWLGSDFCARHILRTLPDLPERPTFWTREQRGEEASTWLLCDHKHRYLHQTAQLLGRGAVRAFCVPEHAVAPSARYERILLFLAMALMEFLGIHVQVTTEPDYGSVEGFVLAPGRQAIIANWVRGDGMWHVDVTSHTRLVHRFTDIAGYVATHSIIEGPNSVGRLQALASYLGLDWAWLTRRCADLSQHGTAALISTRSRLVSSAGVDAACAFVGSLAQAR